MADKPSMFDVAASSIPPPWPEYVLGTFVMRSQADPNALLKQAKGVVEQVLAHSGEFGDAQKVNAFTGSPLVEAVVIFAAQGDERLSKQIATLQQAVEQLQDQMAQVIAKAAEMGVEL